MRLGMLIPEFPTQTHVFFWREICALREMGVDVRLLSTRRPSESCPHAFARMAVEETHYVYPPKPRALALLASATATARTVAYVRSLSEPLGRRLRALGLVACAADLASFARISMIEHIHVHSCADAAHIAALARLLGGPSYSLHLHGDLSVYGRDHAQKARLASFVVAAAEPMERQLQTNLGLAPERTLTLPMGVDTSAFSPAERSSRKGPLRLITVARLSEGKGHRYALAALRATIDRGHDVAYTIVGSGPDRGLIEENVSELGLIGRVRVTGSLAEDAVVSELRESDAFLLPSVGVFEASLVAVM
jgi:colanic acid/amylovoran biosynthesis glycosyltransferase